MNYEALAQDALRGVAKAARKRAASPEGLPGAHHLYVTFKTDAAGVSGPNDLLSRYPDEMTIVLQHQYWNLHVHDDRFEVELSFDNVPEHLVIPFDAVKGFLDPAVQFGLQFEAQAAPARPREVEQPKTAAMLKQNQPEPDATMSGDTGDTEDPAQGEPAKVVSLDQFRKK
jgi:hypothetical protein